jgi:hypothetical protein
VLLKLGALADFAFPQREGAFRLRGFAERRLGLDLQLWVSAAQDSGRFSDGGESKVLTEK